MRIKLTSIMVEDQSKALRFYTETLGFKKKSDFPMGEEYRWITVVSPETDVSVPVEVEKGGGGWASVETPVVTAVDPAASATSAIWRA